MKKWIFLLAILILGGTLTWQTRNQWIERALEVGINQTQQEFIVPPLDIQGLELTNDLKLKIEKIEGIWVAAYGGFPFQLNHIETRESVLNFVLGRPVTILFDELKPKQSAEAGISGELEILNNQSGEVRLNAQIVALSLSELEPINPETFQRSSGRLEGQIRLVSDEVNLKQLNLSVYVDPPGGRLPADFFDLLLPYLPQVQKEALAQIKAARSVPFEQVRITGEILSSNELKMLLKIRVSEYNLNLNLNLTLRLEENASFLEVAKLLGLVKMESL